MIITAEQRASELRSLAARLLQVANDIDNEQSPEVDVKPRNSSAYESWDGADSELILAKANEIYRARRRRKRFFDPALFGEPAWDLLLDLFIARLKKKRVSVSSACYAADVPPTTALRWLGVLADSNLIERFESETDQRVTWVRLTDHASQLMAKFVRDMSSGAFKSMNTIDDYLIEYHSHESAS